MLNSPILDSITESASLLRSVEIRKCADSDSLNNSPSRKKKVYYVNGPDSGLISAWVISRHVNGRSEIVRRTS